MSKCAFLMSSCDSYGDTWDMFYQLVAKYWPDCPLPMYLNTETARYSPPGGLELTVCNTRKDIPWGERMIRVLDMIPEKYVLLVLDDFFLQAPVDGQAIDALVERMEADESIGSFQLKASRWAQEGSRPIPVTDELHYAPLTDGWYTHFVPTIWRKETLRKWLRRHESIWGFELYGSHRAGRWHYKEKVLVVDSPVIYDYVWVDGCSAIVNGKWVDSPVIDDFVRQNGVDIDLDRRGRISIAEYRSRTMKDTLKRLSFFEIVRRVFNRMRSFF